MNFDDYMIENPRDCFPDEQMKQFLEYAKKRYSRYEDVNWTSCDDEEERDEEIKNYLGESMEALLLFREFLRLGEKKRDKGFSGFNTG